MPRQTTNKTKLGALIRLHPKPMYVIAAETGIAFSQLSRYANLIDPVRPHHMRRLSAYFDVEPEDVCGIVDPSESRGGTPEVEGGPPRGMPRPVTVPL